MSVPCQDCEIRDISNGFADVRIANLTDTCSPLTSSSRDRSCLGKTAPVNTTDILDSSCSRLPCTSSVAPPLVVTTTLSASALLCQTSLSLRSLPYFFDEEARLRSPEGEQYPHVDEE